MAIWDLPDGPMEVKRHWSECRGVLNHVDGIG
jgi:hypothetical protein